MEARGQTPRRLGVRLGRASGAVPRPRVLASPLQQRAAMCSQAQDPPVLRWSSLRGRETLALALGPCAGERALQRPRLREVPEARRAADASRRPPPASIQGRAAPASEGAGAVAGASVAPDRCEGGARTRVPCVRGAACSESALPPSGLQGRTYRSGSSRPYDRLVPMLRIFASNAQPGSGGVRRICAEARLKERDFYDKLRTVGIWHAQCSQRLSMASAVRSRAGGFDGE
jgi:hypothetical protein